MIQRVLCVSNKKEKKKTNDYIVAVYGSERICKEPRGVCNNSRIIKKKKTREKKKKENTERSDRRERRPKNKKKKITMRDIHVHHRSNYNLSGSIFMFIVRI